ncbi:hypothetical protein HYH02_006587 [Chlamydomonas schloesseri]|uniref:C2 domain-containing protein n=1 Tax=Chlamydomonas schloesseri TaxID=2026947 RepID=A0A835W4I1_9CHLO|nr:hypothetical protein HYH02_006587 [Chlamydomonas schloesseri]|eukprot:KAG2439060.1 hypothetical protein HYH02_006587 [Chlamydomonas schloesseri]
MALDSGTLTVTVEAAYDLKDPEWVGRQDPYCVIRVGGQTFRTRTAVDGGRNPVWNETFRFSLPDATDTDVVDLVLKDDQLVEHDATLGAASIPLAKARQAGRDRARAPVISPQHHRHHGTVSLALLWEPGSCQQLQPDDDDDAMGPRQLAKEGGREEDEEEAEQQEAQLGKEQQRHHHHHHGGGTPRERVDVVEFVAQRPVA